MYSYEWDVETGGILLNSSPLSFSKEPRPVYYKELDILGFNQYWKYDKDESAPYLWAEANNYFYRGRKVAKTKGGSLYTPPEIIILEEAEPEGVPLRQVDISLMVKKNQLIIDALAQDTIKKIYNTYIQYKKKIDVFYVAFSGGKDSVVTLDLVQRALPHHAFKVLFGDTGMEFVDTYGVVDRIANYCEDTGIQFYRAKSRLLPEESWKYFGPPAVTNRWCCSVHKTAPQIQLLKHILSKKKFKGMAFTGVRGDESASRSQYDSLNLGSKHNEQYSFHPILEWNSAEIFLYIYRMNLIMNETYKKGNSRAGCLVCPMSSGRHEYIKHSNYDKDVDILIEKIRSTSGKTTFTEKEMTDFIEAGKWKSRKTGRELNLGYDKHIFNISNGKYTIRVFDLDNNWKIWAKTIGDFIEHNQYDYSIVFQNRTIPVHLEKNNNETIFTFPECLNSKSDIKFISLFKSVIIKSIYCIHCGVCEAECVYGCIDMTDKQIKIDNQCKHCYKCHQVHDHCVRYGSIRNKIGVERKMSSMGHYFTFGVREEWLRIFKKYNGSEEFWDSEGDGKIANKKKDAFRNFLQDAGIIVEDKLRGHDKYTRNVLTAFGESVLSMDTEDSNTWALILCNLVYTNDLNWFVKNIPFGEIISPDWLVLKLDEVLINDLKGRVKRNVIDSYKFMMVKTPLGNGVGMGKCDYEEKTTSNGQEQILLKTFVRKPWDMIDARVILYSLYKFAEACEGYYQFTLNRLCNLDVESEGVSPVEIFGIERDEMERILNGLSAAYPEYINATFTLDLDNVTLRSDKTSEDILALF